jgi:UDP-2,3-diacylglucosamine pyrophosphatase LpxH
MLAVLSDLHFTDETTACNVHGSAFEYLGDAIVSASKKGTHEVHLLLLGDIFDLVRTSYWLKNGIARERRPWGGHLSRASGMNSDADAVERQFNDIFSAIIERTSTRGLIDMINMLPAATGKQVTVTFVPGNHDRIFNNIASLGGRLGALIEGVELRIANRLHAPEYGVLARHGHEWDPICHGFEFANGVLGRDPWLKRFDPSAYEVMAIGEPITAELMAGFLYRTRMLIGTPNDDDRVFLRNLQDANNLRPMLQMFHWIGWHTKERWSKYEDLLAEAIRESLEDLLSSSLAARWDRMRPDLLAWGDITDHLSHVATLLNRGHGLEPLRTLVLAGVKLKSALRFFLRDDDDDDLVRGAEEEYRELDDDRIQYILYGHTHEARHDCFHAAQDGRVRMYINTGTYLPLIERSRDGLSYASAHQMTMAFFYRDDEDAKARNAPGPTVDLWNGIRRKDYLESSLLVEGM